MSVADFATMLAYLVRVCWSAAAGQLHLASIGDSQPPSPAQHSIAREREGGGGQEGGESLPQQLKAGLVSVAGDRVCVFKSEEGGRKGWKEGRRRDGGRE